MRKKSLLVVCSLVLALSVSACNKKDSDKETTSAKADTVVTSQKADESVASTKAEESTTSAKADGTTKKADDTTVAKKSLKIEEGKEWVYDAEYEAGDVPESFYYLGDDTSENKMELLLKDIKAPYINIDSSYADVCNKEIKDIFDSAIEVYKKGAEVAANKDYAYQTWVKVCDYKYWINGDCLSVFIKYWTGGSAKHSPHYYVYNINLKTGEKITNSEIRALAGEVQEDTVRKLVSLTGDAVMESNYSPDYYKDAAEREKLAMAFREGEGGLDRYLILYDSIPYFLAEDSKLCVIWPFTVRAELYCEEFVISSQGEETFIESKTKY